MAPINTNRYDTSTLEIPFALHARPSGRTLRQHTGSLPHYYSPIDPHLPVIPRDPQTFPILPEQLEKHLEQVQQCLTPAQATPASGSAPSPDSDKILVPNPPPGTMPTVYAFHASTLGMPSVAEYLRFFTRYLDEMAPNKRGKALIDSELLRRIKSVLALQRKGFSGPGVVPPTSRVTGGSWDTQPFRRWVRNNFVCRPATQIELERAIDFGLLSPPESSLSGPGVPGYPPSTGLTQSMDLVFHQDRPVALRSRIYKIILRAHWIANHAGRDKTWAMVREVCSYIPKCLVYDFVAGCPTCRVARQKQYGIPRGISTGNVEELLKFREWSHNGSQNEVGKDDSNAKGGLPPILPVSSYDTPPVGWIPRISPSDPPYPYPIPMPTCPLWHSHGQHETDAQIISYPTPDLPSGPFTLPPLSILLPLIVPSQAADRSQQPNTQN